MTNPSLLLAKNADLLGRQEAISQAPSTGDDQQEAPTTKDFMRIICPKCKCELNIRL